MTLATSVSEVGAGTARVDEIPLIVFHHFVFMLKFMKNPSPFRDQLVVVSSFFKILRSRGGKGPGSCKQHGRQTRIISVMDSGVNMTMTRKRSPKS